MQVVKVHRAHSFVPPGAELLTPRTAAYMGIQEVVYITAPTFTPDQRPGGVSNRAALHSLFLYEIYFIHLFILWLHHVVCGILVPQPVIQLAPLAMKARNLNYWTATKFPPCTL